MTTMSAFKFNPIDYEKLSEAAWQIAEEKGWHTRPRSIDELVELIHGEISEAYEEYRNNHGPTEIYYNGEKPEGIPVELADVVIRMADAAKCLRFSLRKRKYHWHERVTRCQWLSTLSFDEQVVSTFRIVRNELCVAVRQPATAMAHRSTSRTSRRRFLTAIAFIEAFCEANEIQLADAIELKMAYNRTRPYRHGGKRSG